MWETPASLYIVCVRTAGKERPVMCPTVPLTAAFLCGDSVTAAPNAASANQDGKVSWLCMENDNRGCHTRGIFSQFLELLAEVPVFICITLQELGASLVLELLFGGTNALFPLSGAI